MAFSVCYGLVLPLSTSYRQVPKFSGEFTSLRHDFPSLYKVEVRTLSDSAVHRCFACLCDGHAVRHTNECCVCDGCECLELTSEWHQFAVNLLRQTKNTLLPMFTCNEHGDLRVSVLTFSSHYAGDICMDSRLCDFRTLYIELGVWKRSFIALSTWVIWLQFAFVCVLY